MNDNSEIQNPYEGQKFSSFEVLKEYLEEYGKRNYFKFWIRSSHTINSLKSKAKRKINPDLKYVCMKFACIFGGEKIRCRGTGVRRSSTYRNLGCPCMINAVVGEDGNHVKLDTVLLEHNHALCKSLYNSVVKSRRKLSGSSNDSQNNIIIKSKDDYIVNDSTIVMQDVTNLKKEVDKIENEDLLSSDFKNIQEKFGDNVKIIVVDPANEVLENSESKKLLNDDELENQEVLSLQGKEVCRLCLTSEGNLSPIFNPELPLESTILSFKIMGCASIEVSNDDSLPKNICGICEATLDIAYNFRLKCEKSDSILRRACLLNSEVVNTEEDKISYKNLENNELEKPNNTEDCFKVKSEENSPKNGLVPKDNSVGFSCPVCFSNFISHITMLNHLKEHPEDSMIYNCNYCNAVCASIENLHTHMCEHINEISNSAKDLHSCSECDLLFWNLDDLKTHESSHVNDESTDKQSEKESKNGNPYLCNVCGKILKTRDRFQSHKNAHEGLRPHECSECGKGFADRKNMHQHYDIVHLRKAKHECPVCQKKFYTPTKMKSHLTMHYGVKPFTCDVCSKTFRLKMNMIKHKKTHSNDRPHQCDKCNAAFIDKNMLKRHSYIHGGIRPYPCPICGHRFSVKFHLKKHLEKSKCHGNNERTTDEWLEMPQPEANVPGNEWVVIYESNEENQLLNETENEPMGMDMLEEYNVEANKEEC